MRHQTGSKRARILRSSVLIFSAAFALLGLFFPHDAIPDESPGSAPIQKPEKTEAISRERMVVGTFAGKQITLPIYLPHAATPAVVVRVEKAFPGKKQKGFLRIGPWQVLRVEGLEIEFLETANQEAMQRANLALASLFRDAPVECQKVTFTFPGENSACLEAERAEWKKAGEWHFSKGVKLRMGDREIRAERAFLSMTGHLRMPEATPPFQAHLFSSENLSATKSNKEP